MIVIVAIFTVIWYYTSSKNAVATQHLVQQIMPNRNENVSREQMMVILTTYQLLAGLCIALPIYFILKKFDKSQQTEKIEKDEKIAGITILPENITGEFAVQTNNKPFKKKLQNYIPVGDKPFLMIGIFHSLGSLFTNLGFTYGSASVVQIIKLIEPIETLVLTVIFEQSFKEVTARKYISMMVMITGTAILLSQKKKDSSVNIFSITFALLSGASMSFRNVTVKYFQTKEAEKTATAVNAVHKYIEITSAGAMISCIQLLFTIQNLPRFSRMIFTCEWYGFQAIVFHGLFNLASISVLSFINASSHSLLNVGKRILNVLVATMAFDEKVGEEGVFGLVIAFIGGIAYSLDLDKMKLPITDKTKRKLPFLLLLVTVLPALLFGLHYNSLQHYYNPTSTTAFATALHQQENAHDRNETLRERKVILLGPHDRYNFGDLLFCKVLKRLLVNRAGYSESDILFGGIVSINMTDYGGEGNIRSMKQLQQMSREDSEKGKGPYDIIYAGGEALGCSHDCAVSMMFNETYKKLAKQEKIYDCGYLVPKHYLVPEYEVEHPSNFAIINSMGGRISPACAEAANTADFGSFRDPTFPSYPDSAVMTKELYAEEIDIMADQVMNEIFPSTSERKYIAVQHRRTTTNLEKLAASLDILSEETNATIVFFAAGIIPNHDSFDMYSKVATLMTHPSIVYEGTNVWKVVALISRSQVLISTSLHCRIIAFIFFRPRFTWCRGGKHENFISKWDSKDAAGCMTSGTDIWPVLSDYYGPDPKITQEKTKEKYERVVNKYLMGFDSWSTILRKKYGNL